MLKKAEELFTFEEQTVFLKAWMEFIRNLIVVSVLYYIASRTDTWYLLALKWTTMVFFSVLLAGQLGYLSGRLFPTKSENEFKGFRLVVGFIASVAILVGINFWLAAAVAEISRLQVLPAVTQPNR
jgi:hypothetical protein